jgi:tetratricopeptide (TPR) repeat protein
LGKTTEAREEFDSAARATEADAVYASLAKSALQASANPQDSLEVMMRSLQGEPSYNLLDAANLHAYRLRQRNDVQNAVRLRAEVVNAAARKWPADFPVLMRYRLDLAEMLLGAGEYDRAETVARAVSPSSAYPDFAARAKGISGRIAARTGREAAATTTAPSPSAGGDPWTEEMIASATLEANKLRADNRLAESENVQRQIVAQAKRIWPATSSKVTVLQGVHASVLTRLKRFGEAEALYHEIYSARMSESDQTNAKKALIELGKLYELSGEPQKHVELQKLMSETHLPAQLPAALARVATPPTSKPAASGPAYPATPTHPTTLQAK